MSLRTSVRTSALVLGLIGLLVAAPPAAAVPEHGEATRPTVHTGPSAGQRVAPTNYMGAVYHISLNMNDTKNYDGVRCWNQFAPGVPDGLPMAQSYRNCNGYNLYVRMGYYYNSVFVEDVPCYLSYNGDTVFILRFYTIRGASYTTIGC